MKQKVALALIIITVIGVVVFKFTNVYGKPAENTPEVSQVDPIYKMDELLTLAPKEQKPLLMYIYGKGNCESCAKAAARDLPLVKKIESEMQFPADQIRQALKEVTN